MSAPARISRNGLFGSRAPCRQLDEAIRLEQLRARGMEEDPENQFSSRAECEAEFDEAWERLVTASGSVKAALRQIAYFNPDELECIVWDRRKGYMGVREFEFDE